MLDVTQRLVVIVGGGGVAVRKAKGLIDAGATRVRCVAPMISAEMPGEVERVDREFQIEDLEGASLAFAATDLPEVNDLVVEESRRRGVLVNRADVDEDLPGDFTTPALLRDDAVTICVSAEGSPLLAARIRDGLRGKSDPRLLSMAAAMRALRPLIRSSGQSAKQRKTTFATLAGDEALEVLDRGGVDGLKAWLRQRQPPK